MKTLPYVVIGGPTGEQITQALLTGTPANFTFQEVQTEEEANLPPPPLLYIRLRVTSCSAAGEGVLFIIGTWQNGENPGTALDETDGLYQDWKQKEAARAAKVETLESAGKEVPPEDAAPIPKPLVQLSHYQIGFPYSLRRKTGPLRQGSDSIEPVRISAHIPLHSATR